MQQKPMTCNQKIVLLLDLLIHHQNDLSLLQTTAKHFDEESTECWGNASEVQQSIQVHIEEPPCNHPRLKYRAQAQQLPRKHQSLTITKSHPIRPRSHPSAKPISSRQLLSIMQRTSLIFPLHFSFSLSMGMVFGVLLWAVG